MSHQSHEGTRDTSSPDDGDDTITFVPEPYTALTTARVRGVDGTYMEEEVIGRTAGGAVVVYDPVCRSRSVAWDDIHPDDQARVAAATAPPR